MEELLRNIEKNEKYHLSASIRDSYLLSIEDYIKKLYNYTPEIELEADLKTAFTEQMQEEEIPINEQNLILKDLEAQRTVQTAPHTSLISSPRMLCIDWMVMQGLPDTSYYITGAFSGVPFSNKTHPAGKIPTKEKTYNLIPARLQDALVYSSKIDQDIQNKIKKISSYLHNIISIPDLDISYSTWANKVRTNIQKEIFETDKIVILDINKIITKYILKIIDQNKTDHIIYKLLFNKEVQEEFFRYFGDNTHFFYSTYTSKKYHKQESLYIDGYCLDAEHTRIKLTPKNLKEKLENGTLCPATILTFTVLSFLNGFQCLGSFAQVEYLTKFKENYKKMREITFPDLESIPTTSLTTGMFPRQKDLTPLSILLKEAHIHANKKDLLKDFYLSMQEEMLLY